MSTLKNYWNEKKKTLFADDEQYWMEEVKKQMDSGEGANFCVFDVDSKAHSNWLRKWAENEGLVFEEYKDSKNVVKVSWDF